TESRGHFENRSRSSGEATSEMGLLGGEQRHVCRRPPRMRAHPPSAGATMVYRARPPFTPSPSRVTGPRWSSLALLAVATVAAGCGSGGGKGGKPGGTGGA